MASTATLDAAALSPAAESKGARLGKEAVQRYCRQMLVPQFGVSSQVSITNARILVVGAGGLGCSAILYLAGAGAGTLHIMDGDVVERSNLHRQVMHTDEGAAARTPKAESARQAVNQLNPSCLCIADVRFFNSNNAMEVVSAADAVIDATDNVPTRYLLSDACVLAGKPLISGAAVGTDGQATVYSLEGGPCYRCRYPRPPGSVRSCADAGVLGPVPGMIGCMLAMEAIKVVANIGRPLSQRLYHYDALDGRVCVLQLPSRRKDCDVCGDSPIIRSMEDCQRFLNAHELSRGIQNCSRKSVDNSTTDLPQSMRISCKKFSAVWFNGGDTNGEKESSEEIVCGKASRLPEHAQGSQGMVLEPKVPVPLSTTSRNRETYILLDVRSRLEFNICALPGALNIPASELKGRLDEIRKLRKIMNNDLSSDGCSDVVPIFVLCRRGVSSVRATHLLADAGFQFVMNIDGGLTSWVKDVNPDFPMY